ncbi:hypothetical protein [Draconibacterium sediminis]|uniref:hypothetical protein n=1 Tax=Draconibacterium sediminis TaxID=1544798 RepID=UPI0026EAE85D|nr:hypothetical protein [Draconibacterium sediminis]
MRKLELPQFRIYYFECLNIDEILKTHRKILNPTETFHPTTPDYIKEHYDSIRNTSNIIPRNKELEEKYHYFIHMLIIRSFKNDEWTRYRADILKQIFGNDYSIMIKTLVSQGYILRSNHYQIGKYPYAISLLKKDSVRSKKCYDHSFEKYQKKRLAILTRLELINDEEISTYIGIKKKNVNASFIRNYQVNLNKLKIINENDAREFINTNKSLSTYSKEYYHYSLSNIKKKKKLKEPTPEKDNRFYHQLTNLPKELKSFINIKYQIDISNSHPLLFSYILINQFDISYDIINDLKQLFPILKNNIPSLHNDSYLLDNIHYSNVLKFAKNTKIKKDIIQFLYVTVNGILWDSFMELDVVKDRSRDQVKTELFKEVFYSFVSPDSNKEYAKMFKTVYPTVYKIIKEYRVKKKDSHNHLSHKLMKLESEIFIKILKKLFKKKIRAIHIHDAIVVLNVPENDSVKPEDINREILDVYRNYKLIPFSKIEYFTLKQTV